MDTSSIIRAFVSSCNDVSSSSEAGDSEQIMHNLDILLGHWSSLDVKTKCPDYSPRSNHWRDCISCVISLLLDARPAVDVAAKALCFLQTLVQDPRLKEWLCQEFQPCSALAVLLQSSVILENPHLLIQVIQLLKVLVYRHKSVFTESSLVHLVKVLVKHIEEPTSDLALPCLQLLNFVSWTPENRFFIGRLPNFSQICKLLLCKMNVQNPVIVIHVLSTLANLPLLQTLSSKIFCTSSNMKQVSHLVLSIITSDDLEAQNTAVDLFQDLLSHPQRREELLRQKRVLVPCLRRILENPPETASSAFTTVLRLLVVLSAEAELFDEMFFQQSNVSGKLDALLNSLLALICLDGSSLQTAQWTLMSFAAFFKHLRNADKLEEKMNVAEHVLQRMMKVFVECQNKALDDLYFATEMHQSCLTILYGLWESGSCGKQVVRKNVSSAGLMMVLKPYFTLNPLELTTSDMIVEIVLSISTLILALDSSEKLLEKIFQELAGFLSIGLSSTKENVMQQAFQLLCAAGKADGLSGEKFLRVHAAVNQRRDMFPPCTTLSNPLDTTSRRLDSGSQRLQEPPLKHSRRFSIESSIEDIAHRLENGVEVGDLKKSDIMSVYEGRILALKSKEEKLQQLLTTQSMMLQESDRLLNQHLCSQTKRDSEIDEMRTFLRQSEGRFEEVREEHTRAYAKLTRENQVKDDQLIEARRRIKSFEQQVKQMEECNEALQEKANRLEVVEKNLERNQKENESLSEMIAMLQRHSEALKEKQETMSRDIESLQAEKKGLLKSLKEKDARLKEQAKCLHILQTKVDEKTAQVKSLTFENADLQDTNSTLQRENSRLEQELSSSNTCRQKTEACLQEKVSLVQKLTTDLEKFRQMQAMIRNISANNIL